MTAKVISLAALAASALLAGCDYCPRPGVLELTPQFYRPGLPKYPVPNVTPCGIEVGPAVTGKPVYGGAVTEEGPGVSTLPVPSLAEI